MLKVLFVISFFLAAFRLTAQTFTVGDTCCNYHLANKTFTSHPPTTGSYSSSDSYSFDIDGDMLDDIFIKNYFSHAIIGLGVSNENIYIISPSNVESIITYSNNSYTIDNLSYGTILSPVLNWQAFPANTGLSGPPLTQSVPVVFECLTSMSSSYCVGLQTNPFYIAFRKVLSPNDTIYGWINMDSHFPGKVVNYAYTCGSYTGTPQPSTIITIPSVVQKNDSVQLNATPGNGVYYGPGIYGNYFKTKNLAPGIYTVNYAIPNMTGCSTDPSSITFTVTSPALVKENGGINSNISVYPNPANGKLNVTIKGFQSDDGYSLKLISLDGKILKQQPLNSDNNEIDISNISNGIYFIEVTLENSVSRKKLVINR